MKKPHKPALHLHLYVFIYTFRGLVLVSIVVRGGTNVKEGRWDAIYYMHKHDNQ